MTEPTFYTVTQVASALGVTRQAIHDRISHGRLEPTMQLASGAYLFDADLYAEVTRLDDV